MTGSGPSHEPEDGRIHQLSMEIIKLRHVTLSCCDDEQTEGKERINSRDGKVRFGLVLQGIFENQEPDHRSGSWIMVNREPDHRFGLKWSGSGS